MNSPVLLRTPGWPLVGGAHLRQYTGLLRDQDDPYAEAGMEPVFRDGPKRAGRWAVRHPSGGFSCMVSLDTSPEMPHEELVGAVTACLTGR
jgi:hypothetical protein